MVDERVWAVKTHTPWLIEQAPAFRANKVIIIVRNPLDSIYSWFTCAAFYNHQATLPFRIDEEYPTEWARWV